MSDKTITKSELEKVAATCYGRHHLRNNNMATALSVALGEIGFTITDDPAPEPSHTSILKDVVDDIWQWNGFYGKWVEMRSGLRETWEGVQKNHGPIEVFTKEEK